MSALDGGGGGTAADFDGAAATLAGADFDGADFDDRAAFGGGLAGTFGARVGPPEARPARALAEADGVAEARDDAGRLAVELAGERRTEEGIFSF